MYICFALLVDYHIQNTVRKMVYDLSENHNISLVSSRLPQHISLKQSFKADDIYEIEKYFDKFAKSIKPFEAQLSGVDLISIKNEDHTNQILWFDVLESSILTNLHDKLNKELDANFNIKMEGFDGDSWKFHSTIAYGYNQEPIFRDYYNCIINKKTKFNFTANKIAMFYSPDDKLTAGNFITYKIAQLDE